MKMNAKRIITVAVIAVLIAFAAGAAINDADAETKDVKVTFGLNSAGDKVVMTAEIGTSGLKTTVDLTIDGENYPVVLREMSSGSYQGIVSKLNGVRPDLEKQIVDVKITNNDDASDVYTYHSEPSTAVTKFKVNVADSIQNGKVTSDKTEAAEKDTVALTVTPDTGYELGTLTVTGADGTTVAVSADNKFQMPAQNVTVTATFVKQAEEPTEYAISVASDIANGKVSASAEKAKAGDEITLTATPDDGYELDAFSVKLEGGQDVKVEDGKFKMPAEPVTVSATFKQKAAEPEMFSVVFNSEDVSVKNGETDLTSGDKVPENTKLTVTIVEREGQTVTIEPALTDGTYIVTGDVEFKVTYTPVAATEYAVNVDESENGSVKASAEKAAAGTKVTLTVKADDGYELESLKVSGATGEISVTDNAFEMPASEVTVTATFKKVSEQPADGFIVTFGSDVMVTGASSGDRVAAGTVLTVKAVERIGKTATVSASVGAIGADGSYTVVGDVSFSAAYTEKEYEEASFSGSIYTGSTFSDTQLVNVPSDSVLQKGARIVIEGKLVVPGDVTVTVSAGAELIIAGIADIRGNLVVAAGDEDEKVPAGRFVVSGEADISGQLSINGEFGTTGEFGRIAIAAGSSAEIGADGTIYGTFEVEDSASLTIAGAIEGDTSFDVAGTLTINSGVPTEGFSVDLSGNGRVSIESVVLGARDGGVGIAGGSITIRDAGLVYYDKAGTNPVSGIVARNTVVIDGTITVDKGDNVESYDTGFDYGAMVTGIDVSVASSDETVGEKGADKDRAGQHRHSSVLSVSGIMTVGDSIDYEGELNAPVCKSVGATVTVTGADAPSTYARVGGALSFGKDIAATMTDVTIEAPVTMAKTLDVTDVTVKGSVTVAAGAVLSTYGKLDVQAPVDASASRIVNGGTVSVSGNGSVAVAKDRLANDATAVDAAYYSVGTSSVVHHYVTIDAGIAALNAGTTRNIDLLGKQVLVASATVPANTSVSMKADSMLDIGSKDSTDVVLTISSSNGTVLKNSSSKGIEVYGTLYAEKMSNVDSSLRSDRIYSDVFSCTLKTNGTPDAKAPARWTNIYTALDNAVSGETVQIQRDISSMRSASVREGVVLDADGWAISVDRKATLSVAGTLDLTDAGSKVVLASEQKNDKGKVTASAGSLAVTGYVQYPAGDIPVAMDDGSAAVLPGAYYSTTSKGAVTAWYTTYANGAADAVRADGRTVTFLPDADGKIALDALAVSGEADKAVTVLAYGDVTARTITLSYATFMIGSGCKADAVFVGGQDSVAVKALVGSTDVSGTAAKAGLAVTAGDIAGSQALSIAADLEDDEGKNALGETVQIDTSVTFAGNVYAVSVLDIATDSVSVAGNLIVYGERDGKTAIEASVASMDVTGTVDIRNGSSLSVEKTLTVTGAATVTDGSLTVGTAVVIGSIDASAADADENPAASFEAGIMYVGIDAKDYIKTTGAEASVKGAVTIGNYVLAAPGAVLPESVTGASSPYGTTRFVVEDRDYLVAYGVEGNTLAISSVNVIIQDAQFQGWYSAEKRTVADRETVGTEGWELVTAKLDRAIYTIVVNTDGGINYVTAGGKLLTTGENSNQFRIAGLTAGTYKLEISPRAGYDVSKVEIYDADNEKTTMDVKVGGATEPTEYVFSMIGSTTATAQDNTQGIIDAINKNTDAVKDKDVSVNVEKDKDNTLTNALLVILVILIVVMAILVAKRMMRS